MSKVHLRKAVIGLVCVTFLVGGCATTGENTAGRTMGTGVGALGGALLGYKKGGVRGAILGGVLGGAAGFAVGWLVDEYTAKKTKSAQQVREQYAQAKMQPPADTGTPQTSPDQEPEVVAQAQPQPPQEPEVHAYAVTVNPDETLLRGKTGEMVSNFDLMTDEGSAVQVEEEWVIVSPDGKELRRRRYPYKEVDGSGGYEFRRKFSVPKDVEQGRYAISSKLFVNGKEIGSTDSGFQVVSRESSRRIARK